MLGLAHATRFIVRRQQIVPRLIPVRQLLTSPMAKVTCKAWRAHTSLKNVCGLVSEVVRQPSPNQSDMHTNHHQMFWIAYVLDMPE
jgi:hypothetical protein